MKKRGLLVGAYWFYMYTTFFAIISLVFFVLENPHNTATPDTLRDAYEGKNTLASLAKRSMAADKCTLTLAVCNYCSPISFLMGLLERQGLFEQLPERLKGIGIKSRPQRKRQSSSRQTLSQTNLTKSAPDLSIQMQTNQNAGDHVQNAKSQPNSVRRKKHASLPHDSSTLRHKVVADLETGIRSTTVDSWSPDSMGLQTPENTFFDVTPNTMQDPSGPLPEFSAMMFPSADPFAYPNQPMITLENNYAIKQEHCFDPNLYNTNLSTSCGPYDNQIFMTSPPYLMQGQHTGIAVQNETFLGIDDSNVVMANDTGVVWPQQQQQEQNVEVPEVHYDNTIFGEGWSTGWPPNQGYGQ